MRQNKAPALYLSGQDTAQGLCCVRRRRPVLSVGETFGCFSQFEIFLIPLCEIALRDISGIETAVHCIHRPEDIGIDVSGGGGEHGCAECASLIGGHDPDGHFQSVSHILHDEGRFFCDTAQCHHLIDADTLRQKTVDDRF